MWRKGRERRDMVIKFENKPIKNYHYFTKKEARKDKKKTAITNHSEHKTNAEGW